MNKKNLTLMVLAFTIPALVYPTDIKKNVEDSENGELNVVKIIDFTKEDPLSAIDLNGEVEVDPKVVVTNQKSENTVFQQTKSETEQITKKGRVVAKSVSYTVRGKRYRTLSTADGFTQEGLASWYGPGFHGRKTASGEVFNMNALTAAHKTLPLGSRVRVTNLVNGKTVVVRINDRGPFYGGRVIDISKAAARELGIIHAGTAKVQIETYK